MNTITSSFRTNGDRKIQQIEMDTLNEIQNKQITFCYNLKGYKL